MMKKIIKISLSIFGLLSLMIDGSGVLAQVGVSALKGLQTKPQLFVSISQRNKSVTAALDIHVRIANLTEKDIFLKKVEILMPGEFLGARRQINWQKILVHSNEEQLNPGNERLVVFSIPYQNNAWIDTLINYQLLSFIPSNYDVRAVVIYQVPPAKETVIQEITKIYIEPPLSSLMWGGVLGSLLLALFMTTYRLSKRVNYKSFLSDIAGALALVSAGSVCAIITIILLYRFKDLALPININVNDFYGGIVIGLFTYKLGDWLFIQFFETKSGEPNRVAGGFSPPAPTPPSMRVRTRRFTKTTGP